MIAEETIRRLLDEIALQGSEKAYKTLFVQLYDRLHEFAYGIVRNQEDAEEVVSDFFIALWQRRSQLQHIENPRFYFFAGIKNTALNKLKQQRRQTMPAPGDWQTSLTSVFFNPEELLLSAEVVKGIMQAINDLPPKCRLIFKLVKENGLKYAEVAGLLEISVKTVEAQMAIALRRIRTHTEFRHQFPELHKILTQKK